MYQDRAQMEKGWLALILLELEGDAWLQLIVFVSISDSGCKLCRSGFGSATVKMQLSGSVFAEGNMSAKRREKQQQPLPCHL